jgi:alkylhydroperoxidase family enzyme
MPPQHVEPASSGPTQRYAELVAALVDAALTAPGRLSAERRAAFAGEPLVGPLGDFADKVRRHAYRVTDDDIDALRRHGLDEDAIFELAIACAVGEAHARLQAGLKTLGHDQ